MKEFWFVLTAVLPILFVISAGFVLRKAHWLGEAADASLLKLIVNVLIPCLIFEFILGNQALENLHTVFLAPLLGFATAGLGIGCAWLFRPLAGVPKGLPARTFAFTVGIYNYVYMPLPLAVHLFGRETVGVLFVYCLGVDIALWTLGLLMLTGVSLRTGWKKALNPPVVTVVLAVAINFLGVQYVPQFLRLSAQMLGSCAIPLALLLVGAIIADHLPEFGRARGWRTAGVACALRLGLLPVLFLALAHWLATTVELKRVLVLQAAMPCAVFPLIMTKHYGGDTPTALRTILSTFVVSLITIPWWIHLGMYWLGL